MLGSALLLLAACQYGTAYLGAWEAQGTDASTGHPQADASVPPQPDAYVPPEPDAYVPPQPDASVPPQPDAYVPPEPDAYVPPEPDASSATWTAPDFTLPDSNPQSATYQQSLTLSDNLGKVVVLYFASFT